MTKHEMNKTSPLRRRTEEKLYISGRSPISEFRVSLFSKSFLPTLSTRLISIPCFTPLPPTAQLSELPNHNPTPPPPTNTQSLSHIIFFLQRGTLTAFIPSAIPFHHSNPSPTSNARKTKSPVPGYANSNSRPSHVPWRISSALAQTKSTCSSGLRSTRGSAPVLLRRTRKKNLR